EKAQKKRLKKQKQRKQMEKEKQNEGVRKELTSYLQPKTVLFLQELDMTSTFVSKAALIVKRQLEQKPKCEKRRSPEKEKYRGVPDRNHACEEVQTKNSAPSSLTIEDNVKISTELAVMGNKFASEGNYFTAVKYFTDAIKYNPKEFKLFGNRSFCFEKLQDYEKALIDAELSLGISPGWVKGLFRKGRALAGLRRYEEAAQAFRDVLKLDSSYAEAAQELMRVQIIQLMEYGFTREQSSNALIIHGTVNKALEVLSKLNHQSGQCDHRLPAPPKPALSLLSRIMRTKPHHPARCWVQELFPVWVGNLTYPVPEPVIKDLFSKAGDVISAKVLSVKRCAFVNFTKPEHCDEAIRRFHGYTLNGMKLAVRYPDRIPPGIGISKSALKAHDLRAPPSMSRPCRRPRPPRRPHIGACLSLSLSLSFSLS
uniref:RRM domain-containing protein n=1 Tax=Nothobranchius furzeri TaxID=105023 RepID=A0A8C6MBS4_NOTFU